MSILSLIEAKIGSVNNWPQDILRYLFYIRRPTYFMIAQIAAFSFGNKIPRENALELLEEYNNPSLQFTEHVCERYFIWSTDKRHIHMDTFTI